VCGGKKASPRRTSVNFTGVGSALTRTVTGCFAYVTTKSVPHTTIAKGSEGQTRRAHSPEKATSKMAFRWHIHEKMCDPSSCLGTLVLMRLM
jgi:hypothetical protein